MKKDWIESEPKKDEAEYADEGKKESRRQLSIYGFLHEFLHGHRDTQDAYQI